ncbi:hypothetical protein ABZU76_36220 [Amycolatopsis sp. NPDC005232]|uniref:hypothetical protein n=1 Tax=Amycolatopsis sp. NPDC005232 TaxID=3157027 RepID=UPI0033B55DAA
MPIRVLISHESTAIPCEKCGYPTLHVAHLVTPEGQCIGQKLVCTLCRDRESQERETPEQQLSAG